MKEMLQGWDEEDAEKPTLCSISRPHGPYELQRLESVALVAIRPDFKNATAGSDLGHCHDDAFDAND